MNERRWSRRALACFDGEKGRGGANRTPQPRAAEGKNPVVPSSLNPHLRTPLPRLTGGKAARGLAGRGEGRGSASEPPERLRMAQGCSTGSAWPEGHQNRPDRAAARRGSDGDRGEGKSRKCAVTHCRGNVRFWRGLRETGKVPCAVCITNGPRPAAARGKEKGALGRPSRSPMRETALSRR